MGDLTERLYTTNIIHSRHWNALEVINHVVKLIQLVR